MACQWSGRKTQAVSRKRSFSRRERITPAKHANSDSPRGDLVHASRQVTKKKRSDNTRRRKRDMKRIIIRHFAIQAAEFLRNETLRYPLPATNLPVGSQQLTELFDRQSCVTHNAAHRKGIYGVVPWNRENPSAVTHDNVLPFVNDTEAGLLERPHCAKMVNSGNLRHDQTMTSTSLTFLRSASLATASRYSRMAD